MSVDIEQNGFHMQTSTVKVFSVILKILSHCGNNQTANSIWSYAVLPKNHVSYFFWDYILKSYSSQTRNLGLWKDTTRQFFRKVSRNWQPFYLYNSLAYPLNSVNLLIISQEQTICRFPLNVMVAKMN